MTSEPTPASRESSTTPAGAPARAVRPGGLGELLDITRYTLGPFDTNCYVVQPRGHAGCWIIDASFEPASLIEGVKTRGAAPELLLLTHAHVDHIAGVDQVRRAFPGIPVLLHEAEADWMGDPMLNLSEFGGQRVSIRPADGSLEDGQTLTLGPTSWRVLHTPGHSPGGVAFYNAASDVVVSGDALFAGSIGRTDFPGSDFATLEQSIRRKLYTLPGQTRVLPGHGPPTTIGREMIANPFVRAES
jgi:glyoxylase-like metal-dependent hydrolase (beta-lactamase superfamily II)